jgi:hypothetical protein
MDIAGLLISIVAGAAGGNAAGALMKDKSLGTLWNSVSGVVGGAGVSALLPVILPAIGTIAQGGSLDIGAILSQLVGGGVGGAVIMVVVALIKNAISKKA